MDNLRSIHNHNLRGEEATADPTHGKSNHNPRGNEGTSNATVDETLDPKNREDWESMRELGHRMVDDMMDYLQTTRQRPVWQPVPAATRASLQQPLPRTPQPANEVYEEFLQQVLPYNVNNVHPRFWAWVQGGGTPFGMLADMLASGMNSNVSLGDHSAMYVERQVLDWSKDIFGFPNTASGVLTSGASIANITALVVARHRFNAQIKKDGLRAVRGQLVVYGSAETHNCVAKGVEVIGIGSEYFRKIPVDADYRIRIDALREQIRKDRAEGHSPFCIIGNAGTVNTGAIDDLEALAAVAWEESCWFHIDGAFGAIPKILPEFKEALKGIEQADSLSFDFHKWFYINYEVGCVLIKDAAAHKAAFNAPVNYLVAHDRGLSGGPDPFSNYGMELSRGFKALKVWMLLKENGLEKYSRLVARNIRQAAWLAALVTKSRELELMAPVTMNIVCFRFNPGHLDQDALNRLNREILIQLQEAGIASPSYTILQGSYVIRAAITNHRSTMEDFDVLVAETIRIGMAEMSRIGKETI